MYTVHYSHYKPHAGTDNSTFHFAVHSRTKGFDSRYGMDSYTADGGMDKTSSRQEEGSSAEGGDAHTETLDNGARIKLY